MSYQIHIVCLCFQEYSFKAMLWLLKINALAFLLILFNCLEVIALHCFLICFAQTKLTLFIFFNNWLSKGKRKFSASKDVFSCNTLREIKVTIFFP